MVFLYQKKGYFTRELVIFIRVKLRETCVF